MKILVGKRPKNWDHVLAQVNFSYTNSPNRSMGKSPYQILNGMHPKGVCELWDFGKLEHGSVDGEDFATIMSELHEQVKHRLQESGYKYKQREDLKRREVNFEVGDMVLAHLRKEIFPRGECNKLKMKKIGPCKILRNFSTNSYKAEIPTHIDISPIFNVAYLYPYQASDKYSSTTNVDSGEVSEQQWMKKIPMAKNL